ncbi:phosphatidate cytidylyltransferase [Desulfolucanica intricata]|uniref:phosphatidate cytidylyltransferase n=1 Tax=Desulfolucanica intricata TaxID=1285191 RepID=UPI00082B3268|nr:phosphatidate cytidylyltransferase [Desulfolucanica intricata]
MLWQRILSALVGIPLIITVVWYGQIPLLILTGLIMTLGFYEIKNILFGDKKQFVSWLLAISGILLLGSAYIYNYSYLGLTVTIILFVNLLAPVFFYPYISPREAAVSFYGALYIGLIIYMYLLRELPDGIAWLIFTFVATWSCDTGAYFIGRAFGTHKFAPKLSPKKTTEGAVGGVLGSLAAAYVFHLFYPAPLGKLLLLGVLVGVIAQVGDLVESVLKRQAGIKDSGKLIPGHGGVLDRFDSFLLTAPLVYYYVILTIIS